MGSGDSGLRTCAATTNTTGAYADATYQVTVSDKEGTRKVQVQYVPSPDVG